MKIRGGWLSVGLVAVLLVGCGEEHRYWYGDRVRFSGADECGIVVWVNINKYNKSYEVRFPQTSINPYAKVRLEEMVLEPC